MFKKIPQNLFILIISLSLSAIFALPASASNTNGTIDSSYKYAWGENIGWVNFGCANCGVSVTDSGLSGYALSENIGWIYLGDITNNNGGGTLSGYAWSENTGWIKFNPTNGGVTINSSGEFTGSALGENIGWIIFSGDYKVKTDWRPRSARPACNNSSDDDGDGLTDYPADKGCDSLEDTDEAGPFGGGGIISGGGGLSAPTVPLQEPAPTEEEKPIIEEIPEVIKEVSEIVKKAPEEVREAAEAIKRTPEKIIKKITEIFKPKPLEEVKPAEVPIEELVAKEAPLALQGKWQLLPSEPIKEFVLAPLPKEIRKLAEKFPELGETLKKVGITKITDIEKLKAVKLTLPGLTERVGPEGVPLSGTLRGKLALPKGLPVAKLSPQMKQQLPTEIVFAKTAGELIDFNIALSVGEKGKPQQKISTISGKPLQLVVKPDKPVKSVKGYVVFKSKASQPTSSELPLNSLLASVIFANPIFAKTQDQPVRVEEKLVLLEFEYIDPDGDGIYTAEIQAPVIEGEYEIITVMDFEDPELGKKEIRLVTVIDPEGYIFERDGDKETRIPGAIISLYSLNTQTKQYELWPAKEYQQENPQTTDVRGTYSFLVPEGYYYLKAEAPSYLVYDGKPFQVKEDSGIHINIELKTKYWWLKIVDWKTILLIATVLLLVYNFYKDRIREKLLRR